MKIREVGSGDGSFLREMGLAAHANPASVSEEQITALYEAWGRNGDMGVVAADGEGQPLGAAWHRLFPDKDYFWQAEDETMPEVVMAVRRDIRGRGVGKVLLGALVGRSAAAGVKELCLTVEKRNKAALRLYESFGFQVVSPLVFIDGALQRPGLAMVVDLGGRLDGE